MIEKSTISMDDLGDISVSASVECGFCYDKFTHEIDTMSDKTIEEQVANQMNFEGWRIVETDEMIGICCNECQLNKNLSIGMD